MRNPVVAGNWKMHGNKAGVVELLTKIKQGAQALPAAIELLVFPPAVFLSVSQELLADSNRIAWGAQNVSAEQQGAFTGEISADMLLEFGCRYVLIGHSERRTLYGETDAIVASKFAAVARTAALTPVLCLGETREQREQGMTDTVLRRQLDAVIAQEGAITSLDKAILAYEPVWAIGTGLTASPEQAQAVHAMLRAHIAQYSPDIAKRLRILYGGSVKPENAASLFSMPDIDGGLVGGASLNTEQFLAIARATQ